MSRFINTFFDGVRESMIIGVPDFSENNRFADNRNIENDFKFSYNRLLNEKREKRNRKRR